MRVVLQLSITGGAPHRKPVPPRSLPLLRLTLIALAIGTAFAPAPSAHAATTQALDAAAVRHYDIPAGALGRSLARFAVVSGIALSFDPALADGRQSLALSGDYNARVAASHLLDGSGLEIVPRSDGTYTVRRVPEAVAGDADVALPATNVHAASVQESARGPVNGFVASRSTAGTKTDTSLMETPQAISVIGRDQLDARNVQTLNEALHYTAGVGTYYSNDTRNDAFTIRGFSADYLYLDGTRLTAVAGRGLDQWRVDPYQLERIEVVKGPASVTYGQGEPGGIVNMVSKLPTDTARGQVDLFAGNNKQLGIGIDTSGPVDENGTLLYRFIAKENYAQNQVDYVHGTRTLLAPSLTIRPNADTSLTLMATYLRDNTMDSNNFLPRFGSVSPTIYGQRIPTSLMTSFPGYENYDKTQYSFGYLFDQRLSENWSFRQNFRYEHLDLNNQALFGYALSRDQQTMSLAAMNLRSNYNNVVIDNQLHGKVQTGPVEHTLLAGFDFANQNYVDNEGYGYGYTLNLYSPVYTPVVTPSFNDTQMRQVQRQFGLYVQDQMKYDKHWVLALSGRQDWVNSTSTDNLANTRTGQNDSAFSGRAGLMYLFDSGVSPYVSYATSFQPVVGVTAYNAPYKPLKSRQTELGLKYKPTFMNATFSAALFDLRETNALSAVPDPMLNGSIQVGETRSRGIELEGTAELTSNLKLLAAYTLQDVKVIAGSAVDPTVGKTPAATPRNLASLWLDYTFNAGVLRGLGASAGVQYVGPSYGDTINSYEVGSFTIADMAVHYTIPHWRFVLSANNVFDRVYVSRCGSSTRCQYGQRRNVLLSARYEW
ncbi:TonB-dependent siderophore receptor [Pandoraea sp. NPDC087047]|uniref:TonB-dependent siderophore receptor n=1 Tax=Pandoraea sp. NPDC087047 TaxID=3364390 RepID=UPI003822C209